MDDVRLMLFGFMGQDERMASGRRCYEFMLEEEGPHFPINAHNVVVKLIRKLNSPFKDLNFCI